MKIQYIYGLSAVAIILTACGGSGEPTETFRTLRVFSDGAGVARGTSSDGQEALLIGPEIVAAVEASNNGDPLEVNSSDFPLVASTIYADFRIGTVSADGFTFNVIIVEDRAGEAAIVYLYDEFSDAVVVSGDPYTSAPSGTYVFSGTHLASSRFSEFTQDGVFTLTANFDQKTFTYDGVTFDTTLVGSGFIDTATGRLSSGTMTFTSPSSTEYSTTVYGLLHGDSTSVSGVYHTNDANPDYAGAFVGSR